MEWHPIETVTEEYLMGKEALFLFYPNRMDLPKGVTIARRNDPGGRYETWVNPQGTPIYGKPTMWAHIAPPEDKDNG